MMSRQYLLSTLVLTLLAPVATQTQKAQPPDFEGINSIFKHSDPDVRFSAAQRLVDVIPRLPAAGNEHERKRSAGSRQAGGSPVGHRETAGPNVDADAS